MKTSSPAICPKLLIHLTCACLFFFPCLETLLNYKNTKKSWKFLVLKDSVREWEALDTTSNREVRTKVHTEDGKRLKRGNKVKSGKT